MVAPAAPQTVRAKPLHSGVQTNQESNHDGSKTTPNTNTIVHNNVGFNTPAQTSDNVINFATAGRAKTSVNASTTVGGGRAAERIPGPNALARPFASSTVACACKRLQKIQGKDENGHISRHLSGAVGKSGF